MDGLWCRQIIYLYMNVSDCRLNPCFEKVIGRHKIPMAENNGEDKRNLLCQTDGRMPEKRNKFGFFRVL